MTYLVTKSEISLINADSLQAVQSCAALNDPEDEIRLHSIQFEVKTKDGSIPRNKYCTSLLLQLYVRTSSSTKEFTVKHRQYIPVFITSLSPISVTS